MSTYRRPQSQQQQQLSHWAPDSRFICSPRHRKDDNRMERERKKTPCTLLLCDKKQCALPPTTRNIVHMCGAEYILFSVPSTQQTERARAAAVAIAATDSAMTVPQRIQRKTPSKQTFYSYQMCHIWYTRCEDHCCRVPALLYSEFRETRARAGIK